MLTRQEAYDALKAGSKITHSYFSKDEYYQMKDSKIIADDSVNHTPTFWSEGQNNWRKDGWYIIE